MLSGPGSAIPPLQVVILIPDPPLAFAAILRPEPGGLWRITPQSAEGGDALRLAVRRSLLPPQAEEQLPGLG